MSQVAVSVLTVLFCLVSPCADADDRVFEGVVYDEAQALSDAVLQSMCRKHEGKLALEYEDGTRSRVECAWIRRVAAGQRELLFSSFRTILRKAVVVDGLRTVKEFPSDLSCGDFESIPSVDGLRIECGFDAFGLDTPVTFEADATGRLRGVRMSLDYREMRRLSAESARGRNGVARVHDGYVDVTTDLYTATWRGALLEGDHMRDENGNLEIFIATPSGD